MEHITPRLPLAPLAPLEAAAPVAQTPEPQPAAVASPARPVGLPQSDRSVSAPARATLDSLTLELIEEAPRVTVGAAPRESAAAPVAQPAPVVRVARPRGVGKVLLGWASAAVLAAVVLAPRLRVRLAGSARQVDGTPAPVPTNFDSWRQGAEGNWLI